MASDGLSEYEKLRLQNIQKNNAVLKDLAIQKIAPPPQAYVKKKYNKRKKEDLDGFDIEKRRSSRLQSKPPGSYDESIIDEDDEASEDKPKVVVRRPKKLKSVPAAAVPSETTDFAKMEPLPTRNADQTLHFASHPNFTPNLTPKEVLQLGSFGGGYFRLIHSGVTGKDYKDDYKEFPEDWFEGLDIPHQVTSSDYDASKNKYKVKSGQGLKEWESSGWIVSQDPRGWFQWYCRFYVGRRSPDDERQISRWIGVAGLNGRWKKDLVGKIMKEGKKWDDEKVSPVVRQRLQHWAYRLTQSDFEKY